MKIRSDRVAQTLVEGLRAEATLNGIATRRSTSHRGVVWASMTLQYLLLTCPNRHLAQAITTRSCLCRRMATFSARAFVSWVSFFETFSIEASKVRKYQDTIRSTCKSLQTSILVESSQSCRQSSSRWSFTRRLLK